MVIRVLHVDDEEGFLESARLYLENYNPNLVIKSITNATKALELLKTQRFDVIVSDFQMEMDGLEFLDELHKRRDQTPFIMLTGRGREDVVIQALNTGADYYLEKGDADPDVFFQELDQVISQIVLKKKIEETQIPPAFHSIPWFLVLLGPDGTVHFANKKGLDMIGYGEAEVVGMNWFDNFVPPPIKEENRALFYLISRGEIRDLQYAEHHLVKKGGEKINLFWVFAPVTNNEGNNAGALLCGKLESEELSNLERVVQLEAAQLSTYLYNLAEEVQTLILPTSRKMGLHLDENNLFTNLLESLHFVFDSDDDYYALTDLENNLVYFTVNFPDLLSYSNDELQGKSLEEVLHGDDWRSFTALRKRIEDGEIRDTAFLVRLVTKNDTLIWKKATITVVRGKNPEAIQFIGFYFQNPSSLFFRNFTGFQAFYEISQTRQEMQTVPFQSTVLKALKEKFKRYWRIFSHLFENFISQDEGRLFLVDYELLLACKGSRQFNAHHYQKFLVALYLSKPKFALSRKELHYILVQPKIMSDSIFSKITPTIPSEKSFLIYKEGNNFILNPVAIPSIEIVFSKVFEHLNPVYIAITSSRSIPMEFDYNTDIQINLTDLFNYTTDVEKRWKLVTTKLKTLVELVGEPPSNLRDRRLFLIPHYCHPLLGLVVGYLLAGNRIFFTDYDEKLTEQITEGTGDTEEVEPSPRPTFEQDWKVIFTNKDELSPDEPVKDLVLVLNIESVLTAYAQSYIEHMQNNILVYNLEILPEVFSGNISSNEDFRLRVLSLESFLNELRRDYPISNIHLFTNLKFTYAVLLGSTLARYGSLAIYDVDKTSYEVRFAISLPR